MITIRKALVILFAVCILFLTLIGGILSQWPEPVDPQHQYQLGYNSGLTEGARRATVKCIQEKQFWKHLFRIP